MAIWIDDDEEATRFATRYEAVRAAQEANRALPWEHRGKTLDAVRAGGRFLAACAFRRMRPYGIHYLKLSEGHTKWE